MDRQSSICVIIDVDAAMDSNSLEDSTYLIDTQKPWGSTGEGTSCLTTVTDGEFVHTMNWILLPINSAPRSVPKHAFIADGQEGLPVVNIKGEDLAPSIPRCTHFPEEPPLPSGLPSSVKAVLRGKDRIEPSVIHPPPEILCITGEAVARGVMFPALYGSPALEGGGLYWSATVDTRKQGTFFYDMKIKLTRLAGFTEFGQKVWESCILPWRSRIHVVQTYVDNGFERRGSWRRSPRCGQRRYSRRWAPHVYTTGD